MKNFIFICLLSIFNIGFTTNPNLEARTKIGIDERTESKPFLFSFIEGDQLYLNIPNSAFEKPILFTRHDTSGQYKYLQVVWTSFNDKIVLKIPRIQSTSGVTILQKSHNTIGENILGVFPKLIERSSSKVSCINITNFLLKHNIEWTSGFNENIVTQLSLLNRVKNLENEVIIATKRGLIKNRSKVSEPVYFSFFELPEVMESRRFDYRMGFFDEEKSNISHGTKNSIANITKWRLEKENDGVRLTEPINPITIILSPEIPKKWRPFVRAGIEEWLPAFREAGFKNALVVKEVDSLEDWQVHSLNYSIVRWGDKRNVRGFEDNKGSTVADVIDLRSGEILKADILLGSSYQHLADQYFIRCAPLDKQARQYPFPDHLLGKLIQSLVAHETGHVFGIMDNNFGEFSYPFKKMRDEKWLSEMGHTPSIMTYARHNNIVQPEDNIPSSLLIQKVGPTDHYYIKWAYSKFPDHYTWIDKQKELERIIRLQDSVSWYRYNNSQHEIIGPAATNEVVENDSPIKSTRLALKNIKRVIELLPELNKGQKDNSRLERLYDKTLDLWYHQMRQVVSLIGGYHIHYKSVNHPGKMYTPIEMEDQQEALNFFISNVLEPPVWLTNPVFTSKMSYSTYPDKIMQYQQTLLFELLRPQRMKRFERMEELDGYNNISKLFLSKLQQGLFKELFENQDTITPRLQELQSIYLDKMVSIVEQKRINFEASKRAQDYTDYNKGLVMEQLIILEKKLMKHLKIKKRKSSIGHWTICLKKISRIH